VIKQILIKERSAILHICIQDQSKRQLNASCCVAPVQLLSAALTL